MNARVARIPLREAPQEGAVRMVEIGGRRIGVYRVAGRFHALADRCPHRGAPLCSGKLTTPVEIREGELTAGTSHSVVRCPWHKWEFEIATGRSLADHRLRARSYAVHVDEQHLVVSLDRPLGD